MKTIYRKEELLDFGLNKIYKQIRRRYKMKTSLSWIKAYVPELEVEPQEYMDAMTLSGSKVEGY